MFVIRQDVEGKAFVLVETDKATYDRKHWTLRLRSHLLKAPHHLSNPLRTLLSLLDASLRSHHNLLPARIHQLPFDTVNERRNARLLVQLLEEPQRLLVEPLDGLLEEVMFSALMLARTSDDNLHYSHQYRAQERRRMNAR